MLVHLPEQFPGARGIFPDGTIAVTSERSLLSCARGRQALEHGDWLTWLEREFDWSDTSAQRMILAARRFKFPTVGNLPIEPGAIYVLAEKKTPDAVVEQALARAGRKRSPSTDNCSPPPRTPRGGAEVPLWGLQVPCRRGRQARVRHLPQQELRPPRQYWFPQA
jgi:hypothetical protein